MISKNKNFLLHVGGMRGLAILMVVLFHMLPQYFSQGFFGVDVFLVISGFFLFRSYNLQVPFEICSFIRKKILRIYPVMACAIILACLLMAYAMYSTYEAKILTNTIRYSLCGVVNLFFNKTYSNYFSDSANMNPLLHLWYLAVVIQVYFIWAIGCWILSFIFKRFSNNAETIKRWAIRFVVIASVASFIYSYSFAIHNFLTYLGLSVWTQAKEVPYWDTLGRIWEVAAGGLVFVLPRCDKTWKSEVLAFVGMMLVVGFSLCNTVLFEGIAVLIVIGAVLLIRYLPDSRIRVVFEMRWLTWLGSISFSLYLVHFPILVFFKRYEKLFPDVTIASVLIAVCIFGAYLLWHFVERRRISFLVTFILIAVAYGAGSGLKAYIRHIVEPEFYEKIEKANISYPIYKRELTPSTAAAYERYDYEKLVANDGTNTLLFNYAVRPYPPIYVVGPVSEKPEFILLGDSNAQHWFSGMNEMCLSKGISGLHLSTIVIPLMDRFVQVENDGYKWNPEKAEALYQYLSHQQSIHTVVISILWKTHLFGSSQRNWNGVKVNTTFEDNAEKLREFCDKMRSLGKHVVLVKPSPILPNMNFELCGTTSQYLAWMLRRNKEFNLSDKNHPLVLTQEYYETYYAKIINLFNKWESEGVCSVLHVDKVMFKDGLFVGFDGSLRCRDATHITPPVSAEIMNALADDFEAIIQKSRVCKEDKPSESEKVVSKDKIE